MRFYGIDLPRDLGSTRLTCRRLKVLIETMPADSATVRQARGDDAAWDLPNMLMALIADYLAVANWQRASVGRRPGQRLKPPRPIERPGVRQPGERRFGGRAQPVAAVRERLRRLNRR